MSKIMIFRPSLEEFKDFKKYVLHIENQGAHKMGIAKIIAPEGWRPRQKDYTDVNIEIPQPIRQKFMGALGKYQIYNMIKKPMRSKMFERLAKSSKYKEPHEATPQNMDLLERKYWKTINFNSPIYGADVSGSLYDENQDIWNLRHLGTILDIMGEDYEASIDGVTTTYLYFGMWRSTFAWHSEDMDLYSINYLHMGAPKFWYSIPTHASRKFEQLAKSYFEGEAVECSNFLRHKSTLISPSLLQLHSIPYNKVQQYPGEFIITFPYAFHAGFNTGFNCAESTNFAMPRWIEYGKRAIQCNCRPGMVRFSMKCFVRRFQPELMASFEKGEDVEPHPEDGFANCKLASGKRGINANPVFEDPTYMITELDELREKQLIASKRIPPDKQHINHDYYDCYLDDDFVKSDDDDVDYLDVKSDSSGNTLILDYDDLILEEIAERNKEDSSTAVDATSLDFTEVAPTCQESKRLENNNSGQCKEGIDVSWSKVQFLNKKLINSAGYEVEGRKLNMNLKICAADHYIEVARVTGVSEKTKKARLATKRKFESAPGIQSSSKKKCRTVSTSKTSTGASSQSIVKAAGQPLRSLGRMTIRNLIRQNGDRQSEELNSSSTKAHLLPAVVGSGLATHCMSAAGGLANTSGQAISSSLQSVYTGRKDNNNSCHVEVNESPINCSGETLDNQSTHIQRSSDGDKNDVSTSCVDNSYLDEDTKKKLSNLELIVGTKLVEKLKLIMDSASRLKMSHR